MGRFISVQLSLIISFLVIGVVSCLAVTGGEEVDERFNWVTFVESTFDKGTMSCSGSHLGSYLVLTSAHCVVKDGLQLRKVSVRDGRGVGLKVEASIVYVHKDYVTDTNRITETPDIAVLVIDRDFRKPAITPIEYLWRKHLRTNPGAQYYEFVSQLKNEPLRKVIQDNAYRTSTGRVSALFAGFGYIDCNPQATACKDRPTRPFYVGKYLTAFPDCKKTYDFSADTLIICSVSSGDNSTTGTFTDGSSIQSGDSGGPLVVFDSTNTPILVGVNTFRTKASGDAGALSLISQLDFLKAVLVGSDPGKWARTIMLK